MTALAVLNPIPQFFDLDGMPLDDGFLYFGGVSQNPIIAPSTVYWDAAATIPAAQPIRTSNGFPMRSGTPAIIYAISDISVLVQNKNGQQVFYAANSAEFGNDATILAALNAFIVSLANPASPAQGDALVAVQTTVTGSVPETEHTVNEERTSVFQFLSTAQRAAVSAEAGAAGAVCSTALQAGLDGVRAGNTMGLNTYPIGRYQFDLPLRVKNGTPRMTLRGDNRIRTILAPNAVSIATAPISVNAMVINQDNNPHFCMENFRWFSSVAYTGVAEYCVEGGGADLSCQALFSALRRNIWVSFASTNGGYLTGATQNSVFDTYTVENAKGVFDLVGVGSGDNTYTNFTVLNSFDWVIRQTTDTNGSFAMSVSKIHVYQHQRGRAFDVQNWIGGSIVDVSFEAATGNLGSTGIGKFTNCSGLTLSNLYALLRAGVPACATGLEFSGTSAKISDSYFNADIGCKISGTGAVDLEFVNVDFTVCGTACFQIAANCTGTIRTRGCKFNDSQLYAFVHQTANASAWFSYNDEFLNAGLSGSASSRNVAPGTSGAVVMVSPRIGRTNGGAAAAYFVAGFGSGTFDIYNPIWVGTPPTGLVDPASTQVVNIHYSPSSGQATFAAATTKVVVFPVNQPDANYRAVITFTSDPGATNTRFWISGKGVTGFTLNVPVATSASFDWEVVHD